MQVLKMIYSKRHHGFKDKLAELINFDQTDLRVAEQLDTFNTINITETDTEQESMEKLNRYVSHNRHLVLALAKVLTHFLTWGRMRDPQY